MPASDLSDSLGIHDWYAYWLVLSLCAFLYKFTRPFHAERFELIFYHKPTRRWLVQNQNTSISEDSQSNLRIETAHGIEVKGLHKAGKDAMWHCCLLLHNYRERPYLQLALGPSR